MNTGPKVLVLFIFMLAPVCWGTRGPELNKFEQVVSNDVHQMSPTGDVGRSSGHMSSGVLVTIAIQGTKEMTILYTSKNIHPRKQ